MKISSYNSDNTSEPQEKIVINDKNNDVVNLNKYDQQEEKKKNKVKNRYRYFWPGISDK